MISTTNYMLIAHGHEQVMTIDAGLFGDLDAKEDNNIPFAPDGIRFDY